MMYAQHSTKSHQDRAIELLARESQVSIDEVARLYEAERAKLAVGARLTGYVPIFAARNVRALLRQRNARARQAA